MLLSPGGSEGHHVTGPSSQACPHPGSLGFRLRQSGVSTKENAGRAATSVPPPGAHIADPAPLGLAAFALTTFVLSVVNAGWFPTTVEPVVFGLALAYGGIAQFAAGMWEFAKGNTFGATAFCSYGAFWVSFWWLTGHTDLVKAPASRRRQGRRPLPAGLGHLHRLHDGRRDPGQRRGAGGVRAADAHLPGAGLGRVRRLRRASTSSAATSGCSPRSPPGTPRSPASRPSPSSGQCCRSARR